MLRQRLSFAREARLDSHDVVAVVGDVVAAEQQELLENCLSLLDGNDCSDAEVAGVVIVVVMEDDAVANDE